MTFSKNAFCCSLIIGACTLLLPASDAFANGGAWGGSFGGSSGFSSGGSWGSSGGGIFNGRGRNLLARIGNRASNLRASFGSSGGSSGYASSGGFGSSGGFLRVGLVRRVFNGSTGGSWGGSSGGSSGGYSAYPNYVMDHTPSSYIASTDVQSAAPFSVLSPGTNLTAEQSYPVGDHGFNPNYPVTEACVGCNTIGGTTPEQAFGGAFTQPPTEAVSSDAASPNEGDSSHIKDGGSINDLLEGNDFSTDRDDSYYQPNSGDSSTSVRRAAYRRVAKADQAILRLNVPKDSKIYVNGRLTKTPGSVRSFESKNLAAGRNYHYKIKAIVERDGKQLIRTKLVSLQAGKVEEATLDFESPATTVLALKVPEGASVKLCGAKTELTGVNLRFTTTRLPDGEVCKDYKVEVTYQRDGKMVSKVKTIDLAAGDMTTLNFKETPSIAERIAAR